MALGLSVTSRSSIETAVRIQLILAQGYPSAYFIMRFVDIEVATKIEHFSLEICGNVSLT